MVWKDKRNNRHIEKKREGSIPVRVHEHVTSFYGNVSDSWETCEHLSGEELMRCNDGVKETQRRSDSYPKPTDFSLKTQQNQH